MNHFYGGRRTWKQWWYDVKYWFQCLAKDIEREKYYRECFADGRLPFMFYGPRMVINWKTMKAKRVMPLEDIYNFTIGNFKKVLGIPPAKEKSSYIYAPRVKGNPPAMDIRQIIADSDIKDFIHGPNKKDH